MAPDPKEELSAWRFHLIAEALSPRLSKAERGALVRRIASEEHLDPSGQLRSFHRNTLDRWVRAYRAHGLEGLRDRPRSDRGNPRRHQELIEEAVKLRAERPERSAAHIAEIVFTRHGLRIGERTLREHFQARGLTRAELLRDQRTFGRFEASEPNQRWIADVLVGPFVPFPKASGSQRARLFLIVDDHSRLLVHGRWASDEKLRTGQEVLRTAILRRGVPEQLHVDNGAAYSGNELGRTCAILGIRLIHSRPYKPQGRGKQERLNRVIRERFQLEAEQAGIATLEELNDLWGAWTERYLNTRRHSETGESPLQRYQKVRAREADPALFEQAFLWSARRRVSRTASIAFQGNHYEVDPALVGRWVDLRYRPEDLSQIAVFLDGRAFGIATPRVIERHVHTQLPPPPRPVESTGIDYLGQVFADHEAGQTGSISFRHLTQEDQTP